MKNYSGKDNAKWIQTKTFYAVVLSLCVAIVGIASAIYNVAKVRNIFSDDEPSTYYSVPSTARNDPQPQANANVTNVPDEREDTTTLNDLNRPYSGYYLLPVNNKVIKDYSDGDMVHSKTMNDWRVHDGIDISGNNGDNVIAVQDGKVVDVQTDELWGDVVTLQHGNGLTARYCGVKSTVNKDDSIEQGQVIGTLVAIPLEEKDGMHLHLEIQVDGKTVDPIKALNLLSEAPENTTQE